MIVGLRRGMGWLECGFGGRESKKSLLLQFGMVWYGTVTRSNAALFGDAYINQWRHRPLEIFHSRIGLYLSTFFIYPNGKMAQF